MAALRVELRIPDVHSLKEKRSRIRAVRSALDKKYSVSIAETDHHDLWQRSTLGLALVAPQAGQLERLLHSVRRTLEGMSDVEVLAVGVSYLERP